MSPDPKQAEAPRPRRPLRVLMVEDSQADALMLARVLERGGFDPAYERVETREAMDQALRRQPWDVVLADHSMPQFSAPAALELVKEHGLDVPFIVVSGLIEEETAVAAMRAGAHDYVMKERLARLVSVVERELREAEVRRARREYEAELRQAREELEIRVEQRTAALRAANLELENVIGERRRLENELLEIAENERRRIGFDLHDDLGQKLTGLSLMVKGLERRLAVERHAAAADAGRIHDLIDHLIRHTHNLAHECSSLDASGDNLPAVLEGLAANVKKMFAIPCAFSVKGAIPDLPGDITLQLHKIAQEAVSNAIKHGRAKNVGIALARTSEQLILTIENDGVPFALPTKARNRMGLRIMNYRARTVGASLEIQPLRGSGTVVTCSLPMKENPVRAGTR
jgi:signal transduction histidine kinase